jgi:hypothetical protein
VRESEEREGNLFVGGNESEVGEDLFGRKSRESGFVRR